MAQLYQLKYDYLLEGVGLVLLLSCKSFNSSKYSLSDSTLSLPLTHTHTCTRAHAYTYTYSHPHPHPLSIDS
jgi:hypothetical protein